MPVRRYLPVNGTTQIEIPDNGRGPEVKVLPDSPFDLRIGNHTGTKGIHKERPDWPLLWREATSTSTRLAKPAATMFLAT